MDGVAALLSRLSRRLADRKRLELVRPRAAAVLLPLVGAEGGLSLLMTRRAAAIKQGGQVAFPGGAVDEGDANRVDTALREAEEEVGLPRLAVRVVGRLDDIPNYDNTQAVSPVVGYVDTAAFALDRLVPDAREVQAVFAVPLADLQTESRWTTKDFSWRGVEVQQYFFDVAEYPGAGQGEQLWGLSAYCTLGLLAALGEGGSFGGKLASLQAHYGRRLSLEGGADDGVKAPSDLYVERGRSRL